jgi:hypothetical protein
VGTKSSLSKREWHNQYLLCACITRSSGFEKDKNGVIKLCFDSRLWLWHPYWREIGLSTVVLQFHQMWLSDRILMTNVTIKGVSPLLFNLLLRLLYLVESTSLWCLILSLLYASQGMKDLLFIEIALVNIYIDFSVCLVSDQMWWSKIGMRGGKPSLNSLCYKLVF